MPAVRLSSCLSHLNCDLVIMIMTFRCLAANDNTKADAQRQQQHHKSRFVE